jgi:hypothetical protein
MQTPTWLLVMLFGAVALLVVALVVFHSVKHRPPEGAES